MQQGTRVMLTLEDGTTYRGYSFGALESVAGEVVFNTAMTGYPESLSDPSYRGQILCLSYPLAGNYGAPGPEEEDNLLAFYESSSIHITGLIVSDYSFQYSHWNASQSLSDWLKKRGVPGIYGIDTRALTKRLREKGTMLGKIEQEGAIIDFSNPNTRNLVAEVSTRRIKTYGNGKYRILLIDCGVKYSIIRHLLKYDTTITRVPWDHLPDPGEYDGLFISNGPGDPEMCVKTIENLKVILQNPQPVFGICLGNQLLALASGAKTFKLKYGHRSHNQPVLMVGTNSSFITSQNHGYAVDSETLGGDWTPYFINLNDGTNEGMKHISRPLFSTQFHPEASGGPTDTAFLFGTFIENVKHYITQAD